MKTTKILSTIAFAALMAACSNEELSVVNNSTSQDLSIRPVIENATIGSDDAATRMNIPGKYRPDFIDGDKLGASLIDVATYLNKSQYDAQLLAASGAAVKLYNVVEQIQTNYPYERKDGAWYTQATLVEGNYLFYAPYNAAHSLRFPPVAKLPAKQDVSTEKKAIEDFATSGELVKVGYTFLDASQSMRPSLTMHDIFAYPLITVKNDFDGYLYNTRSGANSLTGTPTAYSGDLKIDSIQIFVANSGNFKSAANDVVEQAIAFGDASHTTADLMAGKGVIANLDRRYTAGDNKVERWIRDAYETAFTSDVLSTTNTDDKKLSKILTTLIVGKTIKKGEKDQFYTVLPAEAYGNNLSARVFVTIGTKQYEINQAALGTNGTNPSGILDASSAFKNTVNTNAGVTLIKAFRYPAQEYNSDGTEKTIAGTFMTINLTGGKKDNGQAAFEWNPAVPAETGIKNNAEMITFFQNLPRYSNLIQGTGVAGTSVGFKLTSDNTVIINATLIDALHNHNFENGAQKGTLEYTSILPIASDVMVTSIKDVFTGITTNGIHDNIKREITFKSLASGMIYAITMPVKIFSHGHTNITGNTPASHTITSDGTYIFAYIRTNATPNTGSDRIVNINIDGTQPLKNVNIINLPFIDTFTGTTATCRAQINLTNSTDAKYITSITNMGNMTFISDIDNSALNVHNAATGVLTNSRTTNVKFNNYGTLNNNGTMMVSATNNGTIVTGPNSITKVNAGTGEINNNNAATVIVSTPAEQTVFYTTTTAFTAPIDLSSYAGAAASINKLIVGNTFTASNVADIITPIKDNAVKEIEFNATVAGNRTFTTNFASGDLSGIQLSFLVNYAWNGLSTGTDISNCNVYTAGTLGLTRVYATGTKTGAGTISIVSFANWTNK